MATEQTASADDGCVMQVKSSRVYFEQLDLELRLFCLFSLESLSRCCLGVYVVTC